MLGAIFLGDRRVDLAEFPDPWPRVGEVVIRIQASGLCGSDLHRYRAEAPKGPPRIVGHEPAGVVCAIGEGVSKEVASEGDRVMVHHYSGCTRCDACRSGWAQMCTTRKSHTFGTDEHGAHAPYMRVPAATLVPLDESLSFVAGAAIGCGTGTAWGALDRLGHIGGRTLVVFGQGPVGLSATMLGRARGARVIAVDPQPSRLAQARTLGAEETIDPSAVDTVEAVRELTRGAGTPLVIETSGASAAAKDGMAMLAPWGRICLVGLGGEVRFDVWDYMRRQVDVLTSWSMSIVQQRRCAEFVVDRRLPVDDLFTHTWNLGQVADAYAEFDQQASGKAAIVF